MAFFFASLCFLFFSSEVMAILTVVESSILTCGHHSLKLCIETTHKIGLLFIRVHMVCGILRKVIEFGHVFHHTFVALLQGEEFFRFHVHKPFWNIMGAERVLKFRLGDLVS